MLNNCLFQPEQLLVAFQFLHLLHCFLPVCFTSSAVVLKICAITAGIKKYNSIFKKKKKKHDKIVSLGKCKLDNIEVLTSKALVHSYISHDKFVSVNVLREYNDMKVEIKNLKFCGIYYINMVDISRTTYARNGIVTVVDNDGILRLNEKHIEGGLDHKDSREITIIQQTNSRQTKKQCNGILVDKKLAISVIMDCRITSAYKFRARLGFKQQDAILTKEQSMLTKIMSSF